MATNKISSTSNLVKYIAQKEILQFYKVYIWGQSEADFEWGVEGFKESTFRSNPEILEALERFFTEEIIVPNIEYYTEFFLTPKYTDDELIFILDRRIHNTALSEHEPAGKILLTEFLNEPINELRLLDELQHLNLENFDNNIRYNCSNGESWCEIYDLEKLEWVSFDELTYGNDVLEIMNDCFDAVQEELGFGFSDKMSIKDNVIRYYTEEQLGDTLIITHVSLDSLEDGIEYLI